MTKLDKYLSEVKSRSDTFDEQGEFPGCTLYLKRDVDKLLAMVELMRDALELVRPTTRTYVDYESGEPEVVHIECEEHKAVRLALKCLEELASE